MEFDVIRTIHLLPCLCFLKPTSKTFAFVCARRLLSNFITEAREFAMRWCWHPHAPSCPLLVTGVARMQGSSNCNVCDLSTAWYGFWDPASELFGDVNFKIYTEMVDNPSEAETLTFFFSGASGSVVALVVPKMTLERFHLFNQQCRKTPSLNFHRTDFR